MDLKIELTALSKKISEEVLKILDNESKLFQSNSNLQEYYKRIVEVSRGGKRLRGILVYYSYLMHGGKDLDEILKVAAIVELYHTYILVMDDIQDKAETRRGVETISKYYKDFQSKKGSDSFHFGNSIAINAGLSLSHLATKKITELNFADSLKLEFLKTFSQTIVEVANGQTLDIIGETEIKSSSEAQVMEVYRLKTATYTFEGPMIAGAIFAGKAGDFNEIRNFAFPAGINFQIIDDILGVFGEESETGKSIKTDIIEGKNTILISKALEKLNDSDKSFLLASLGNYSLTDTDFERVKQILKDSGAYEYSINLAQKYVDQSKRVIELNTTWLEEGKIFLSELVDYMMKRKN